MYEVKGTYFNTDGWARETEPNIMSLLDDPTIRDDFISMLDAIENFSINKEDSRKIYQNMKKVSLAEKKIEEKKMQDLMEKYKLRSEILDDINSSN